jgi:hypothetical protein
VTPRPDFAAAAAAALSTELPPRDDWQPPTVLPPFWDLVQRGDDGAWYRNDAAGLAVALSVGKEADGRFWLHLSISHRARLPRWSELVEAKELFLGNREAYQVVPPRERYVNIHPNCLHLFALLDVAAAALPDFTRGTGCL